MGAAPQFANRMLTERSLEGMSADGGHSLKQVPHGPKMKYAGGGYMCTPCSLHNAWLGLAWFEQAWGGGGGFMYMWTYIYIYIYNHTRMCKYIYIYIHMVPPPGNPHISLFRSGARLSPTSKNSKISQIACT